MTGKQAVVALETGVVPCPKCGAQMHDVRQTKKNARGPDYICSDRSCVDDKGFRTACWQRDLERLAAQAAGGAKPASGASDLRPPKPLPPIAAGPTTSPPAPVSPQLAAAAALHRECLAYVLAHELPLLTGLSGDHAAAVSALTAQLFIQVSRHA